MQFINKKISFLGLFGLTLIVMFLFQNCASELDMNKYGTTNTSSTTTPTPTPNPFPTPAPSGKSVVGAIDGFQTDSVGNINVYGWACAKTLNESIYIHLIVGGVLNVGVEIAVAQANAANLPTDTLIPQACNTNFTNHRFTYKLTQEIMRLYGNKQMYIYGGPGTTLDPVAIAGSGSFSVPALPDLIPVYQAFLGNIIFVGRVATRSTTLGHHFYSLMQNEGAGSGYVDQGLVFYVFKTADRIAGAAPIYRCLSSDGNHFISRVNNCQGAGSNEGLYGYINTDPAQAPSTAKALYRYDQMTYADHFYSFLAIPTGYTLRTDYVGDNLGGILGYAITTK